MRMVLAAAALTALVLMVAAVVTTAQDPEVVDCVAALDAMREANEAHLDAMRALENRFRRGGAEADAAERHVQQAKAELHAARELFSTACHYST